MKINYLLAALATASLLVACEKKGEDNQQKPILINATLALEDKGMSEGESVNVFAVDAVGDGATLSLEFASSMKFLPKGVYKLSNELANMCYKAHYKDAKVDSDVAAGDITLEKEGDDYRFASTLKLSDGNILKVSASGTLVYKSKAEAMYNYTKTYIDQVLSGVNVQGYQIEVYPLDKDITAENILGGFFLSVDQDAALSGTYPIVDGVAKALEKGTALQGYLGMVFGLQYDLGIFCVNNGNRYYISTSADAKVVVSEEDGLVSFSVNGDFNQTSLSDPDNASAPQSIDFQFCSLVEKPAPVGPVYEQMYVIGGTYVETMEAKEGFEQHQFVISNTEGTPVGTLLFRTAAGAESIDGEYTVATEENPGTLSTGMNLLGLMDIGSFFVGTDGKTYYLQSGKMSVATGEDGAISFLMSEATTIDAANNEGKYIPSFLGIRKAE